MRSYDEEWPSPSTKADTHVAMHNRICNYGSDVGWCICSEWPSDLPAGPPGVAQGPLEPLLHLLHFLSVHSQLRRTHWLVLLRPQHSSFCSSNRSVVCTKCICRSTSHCKAYMWQIMAGQFLSEHIAVQQVEGKTFQPRNQLFYCYAVHSRIAQPHLCRSNEPLPNYVTNWHQTFWHCMDVCLWLGISWKLYVRSTFSLFVRSVGGVKRLTAVMRWIIQNCMGCNVPTHVSNIRNWTYT